MSHPEDSDLLRKAAAAMRTERTGHNAGSGFTRARILNDVRVQRKKRSRWWRLGFPLGIILAGTTAWASASGKWPEVLVNISTLLNLPLTDNGASERSLATAKTTNAARSRPAAPEDSAARPSEATVLELAASATTTAEATAPENTAAENSAAAAPTAPQPALDATEAELATARATRPHTPSSEPAPRRGRRVTPRPAGDPRAVTAAVTSDPPPPAPPELEAEIRAFRRADDLYRRSGDLLAAVGAYRQYLRDFPSGRFVPEAKYNTALALVKLGRGAEARPLLTPFADGAYGSYRREAAQRLLEALP